MSQEERAIRASFGKWGQAGVPKKGWRCLGIEDIGAPDRICEMCERMPIRYVHDMEHDDYPDVLRVGCICAGFMEEDLIGARRRDAEMKSRAGKRKRWLTRQWKTSRNGNPTIEDGGYRATVYLKLGQFGATVASLGGDYVRHSHRRYATVDEAKLAAFDHITKLLAAKHRQA